MGNRSLVRLLWWVLCILVCTCSLQAKEAVYLDPEVFLEESFDEDPETKVLWMTKDLKESVRSLMGHPYKALRIRYWQSGERTAWILEEIGKVEPITAGYVIEEGEMIDMQVLIYRESHGWEVRYPFFTTQFHGLGLDGKQRLNRKVDGISGATMSVNALKRLARLALVLHEEVMR